MILTHPERDLGGPLERMLEHDRALAQLDHLVRRDDLVDRVRGKDRLFSQGD